MRQLHVAVISMVIAASSAADCGADEPSRSWITFLSRRSGENVVYKMRPDGSGMTPIFGGRLEDVPGLMEGDGLYREPHWCRQSPDGKYFLDWAQDIRLPRDKSVLPRFMVYLGRLDGGPVRAIAPDGGEYFAWSPDSKRFAYSRAWQFPSLAGGVHSSPTQVLEKPHREVWRVLDWSPDGKKLLLEHRSSIDLSSTKFGLFELDLGAIESKTRGGSAPEGEGLMPVIPEGPSWVMDGKYSPDGTTIAALVLPVQETPGGNKLDFSTVKLTTVDPSRGEMRTVVRYPGEQLWAPLSWSPDGREILFARPLKPDDKREQLAPGEAGLGIWAIRPDGTNSRFLTTGWCAEWR
jgi:hypothetical protein